MASHTTDVATARVTTLAFHSLVEHFTFGSTNYSPGRFRALLESLGFKMGSNSTALPTITFDDGYAHLADILPEMMQVYAFQPIVFVPTAFIGATNSWDYGGRFRQMRHLNETQIRQLSRSGVIFGSHGHGHTDLTLLSDAELSQELLTSMRILEEITGRATRSISYPFGKVSAKVVKSAIEAGYDEGYTMKMQTQRDTKLQLGRIPVYCFDTPTSVAAKLRGSGLRFRIEKSRTEVAQSLSRGTVILQSLRRSRV